MAEAAQTAEEKKIQLEKQFIVEIKSLFARMNKDNTSVISLRGRTLDANEYKGEWQALLRKQYARVQDAFEGDVELTLPEDDRGLSDDEKRLLLTALLLWRTERAEKNSQIITATNQRQLDESLSQAREMHQDQDLDTDNVSLGLTSAALFKRKSAGRVNAIAMTETQSSAESTRIMEATTLAGIDPMTIVKVTGLAVLSQSIKMWLTVGDSLVRPIHSAAGGQRVPINQAFFVGGELLMYPGDSSLGATLKNLANCRCSQFFSIIRVRR